MRTSECYKKWIPLIGTALDFRLDLPAIDCLYRLVLLKRFRYRLSSERAGVKRAAHAFGHDVKKTGRLAGDNYVPLPKDILVDKRQSKILNAAFALFRGMKPYPMLLLKIAHHLKMGFRVSVDE